MQRSKKYFYTGLGKLPHSECDAKVTIENNARQGAATRCI